MGRLCFDTCLSVCPWGGGQSADSAKGGAQVQPGGSGPASRGGSGQVQLGGGGSLHSRWYASCIHAGGLSYLVSGSTSNNLSKISIPLSIALPPLI